jgi:hypothetical protein
MDGLTDDFFSTGNGFVPLRKSLLEYLIRKLVRVDQTLQ